MAACRSPPGGTIMVDAFDRVLDRTTRRRTTDRFTIVEPRCRKTVIQGRSTPRGKLIFILTSVIGRSLRQNRLLTLSTRITTGLPFIGHCSEFGWPELE